jgi:hypothetical protein
MSSYIRIKIRKNAVNLLKSYNEHIISLIINIYLGVLILELKDFAYIDDRIRKARVK